MLGRAWELPGAVQQCVLHHRDALRATKHRDEVLNVAIAIALARSDAPGAELSGAAGLYQEDIEALAERTQAVEAWVGTIGGGV